MSDSIESVTVSILDRDYQVACPAEEKEALQASARYLDGQMREVRGKGKVLGSERIAVTVALNIAHELLRDRSASDEDATARAMTIESLTERIDRVLVAERQMKL